MRVITIEEEEGTIALALSQCTDDSILRGYERLLAKKQGLPPIRHKVVHKIDTGDSRPIAQQYRRLPPDKLAAAKAEFEAMEKEGIIQRSDSPWALPLHMVQKAAGTWRPPQPGDQARPVSAAVHRRPDSAAHR